MIPATGGKPATPTAAGHLTFHVVVDHTSRTFSMDACNRANGVKLHFDVLRAARAMQRRFWEMDVRAASREHALADMQRLFPGYKFIGTWSDGRVRADGGHVGTSALRKADI
jgi:hypothetical protein